MPRYLATRRLIFMTLAAHMLQVEKELGVQKHFFKKQDLTPRKVDGLGKLGFDPKTVRKSLNKFEVDGLFELKKISGNAYFSLSKEGRKTFHEEMKKHLTIWAS